MRSLVLLVCVGCTSSTTTPDATPGDPGHVHFESNCAPTTTIAFPDTAPGQTATAIVQVVNDGDVDVTLGSIDDIQRVGGADAADFVVANNGSPSHTNLYNCMHQGSVLVAHSWCQLAISFTPAAGGAKQATYDLGGAGSLTLAGSATAPAATFHGDHVNVATAYITDWSTAVLLRNDSTATVDLGTIAVDPPFLVSAQGCPASLAPGGACTASVAITDAFSDFPPISITDCRAGHVTTSTTTLDIPVTYTPARPFQDYFDVVIVGDGAGSITSPGGEIACAGGNDPGCQAEWWAPPASIALHATPEDGYELVGWLNNDSVFLPCGNAPDCTVATATPSRLFRSGTQVQAWFAPTTDKHIHITVVGAGRVVTPGLAACDTSCTVDVPSGRDVRLTEETTGSFVGWSGDCTGTAELCALGNVINDRNVTATFTP